MYNSKSDDLRQLLLYLRTIASDGPLSDIPGLCGNVRGLHLQHCKSGEVTRFMRILEECFVSWKFYSGVLGYPVPDSGRSPLEAYLTLPKWPVRDGSFSGRRYGLRRMHLVWHCIDKIKAELDRREKNAEVLWS